MKRMLLLLPLLSLVACSLSPLKPSPGAESPPDISRLTVPLASKHSNRTNYEGEVYNERNAGIGIEKYVAPNAYIATGLFNDSHKDLAFFAGVGRDMLTSRNFALCLESIFVLGHNHYGAAQVCGRVGYASHYLKVGYAPGETLGITDSNVITLQYQKEY